MTDESFLEPAPQTVRALVVYNVMEPQDRTWADLEWSSTKTLSEYVAGLPEDVSFDLGVNGKVIPRTEWDSRTLELGDQITLVFMQERGALNVLLMLVIVVFAVWAAPALAGLGAVSSAFSAVGISAAGASTIIGAVITTIGGLLVNALLPPPKVDAPGNKETNDSPSYGLDGPKPTAKEEVPVPVVYGTYRMGGNRVNYYSQTSPDGKTQTLYSQFVVSEGEIDGMGDMLLNDQDISNYKGISVIFRNGGLTQEPIGWFADTITPISDSRKITEEPQKYTTVDAVDRIRLDVTLPGGLYTLDKKTGNRSEASFTFNAEARNVDNGNTYFFHYADWRETTLDSASLTNDAGSQCRTLINVFGTDGASSRDAYNMRVIIQKEDGFLLLDETYTGYVENDYIADGFWRAGIKSFTIETPVPMDSNTKFRVIVTGGFLANTYVLAYNDITVKRNDRNAIRLSYDSGPLPRGRYEVTFKRLGAESTSDYLSNAATMAAINEIREETVGYNRSAYYALRVDLTDQFNSEPVPTVLVRGRKVWTYDKNGNKLTFGYSDNPADITLDILLSEDWPNRLSPSRIDFPFFSRWRAFCETNNLKFNGAFDYLGNVWDALITVMRVGRAAPLVSGLKWTGVIEGPSDPVMMFGVQNMLKGTFENYWLSRTGRANHIEVQYYDANDNYRRNSVFAINESSIQRGDSINQSSINMIGVTNAEQAQKEADLQLNLNYGIVAGCRFEAGLDALGLSIGDVIYVQHDMPKWGWADRVKGLSNGGNTINLYRQLDPQGVQQNALWQFNLDQLQNENSADLTTEDGTVLINDSSANGTLVPMPAGDWRILVLKPAVLRDIVAIVNVSGSQIIVGGTDRGNIHRIKINGVDYRVTDTSEVSGNTAYTFDRAVSATPGQTAYLYEIDVLLEGTLQLPYQDDNKVQIASWPHSVAIEAGDQIMIGRVGKFKKPFRVVKFSHSSEQNRQIDCIEYNEAIYSASGIIPVTNYSELSTAPLHVLNVTAEQRNENIQGGGIRYYATVRWDQPLNDIRGHAGSRVYAAINSANYVLVDTVYGGRNDYSVEANIGDVIRFKIVAFDITGALAPFFSAPSATVTIGERSRRPDAPEALTAQGGLKLIALRWTIPNDPDIKSIEVYENSVNDLNSAYKMDEGYKNYFVRGNLTTDTTRWYWVRSVSYANQVSEWTGPVSATTSYLLADDIADGIINTAKFASSIKPVEIIPNLSVVMPDGTVAINQADGKVYTRTGGIWLPLVQGLGPLGTLTADQIESLNAAQLTGEITSTQITDSAISTPKIAAAAVVTAKLAAGAVVASKLAVGSANNVIWNPTLYADTVGWMIDTSLGGVAASVFAPALQAMGESFALPVYGSGYARVNSLAIGATLNIAWRPQGGRVPAAENKPYEFQILVQARDNRIQTGIAWYDDAGVKISETLGGFYETSAGAGRADSEGYYQRIGLIGLSPAGTTAAVPFIRLSSTSGVVKTNSDVIFTKALFGEAFENQTEFSNWTAGGVTVIEGGIIRARTIGADRIVALSISAAELGVDSVVAGKIAAGAINAREIAAGAIRADKLAAEEIISDTIQVRNLIIGTNKITSGAASAIYYAESFPFVSLGPGDPYNWSQICSVAVNVEGDGRVVIFASANSSYVISEPGGGDG